ncbi:KptA family-domain-containing protein [Mycena polygramma]|nr:KptA family-domain-containing protein [Mycena polygramma]
MFRAYSGQPAADRPPKRWHGRRRKPVDPNQMRVSRQLSRLIRYGSRMNFLPTRSNGYVNVEALLSHISLRGVDFKMLEKVVREDQKSRYHLAYEPWYCRNASWWIRANPEHRESDTMEDTSLDLKRIRSAKELPVAFHGTSLSAWQTIAQQPGLHRMSRNFIHLAKGVVGDMVNGMSSPSEVLLTIDVARALEADIKFYKSPKGVILTPGNEMGYLERRFFMRVERVKVTTNPVPGWERREEDTEKPKKDADEPSPPKTLPRSQTPKDEGTVRPPAGFLRHLYHRYF